LHKYDTKYRSFFENSADAMLIIENGEFVDCNSATVSMLCYDRKEELINTPPFKLSPEFQPDGSSSLDKADEMMRVARERGSHQFEWDHLRKDGSIIPVEVSLTAIEDNDESYLHTVWRDISERKRAQKAIMQSREFLRKAQEIAHLGSWELHLTDNKLIWSDEVYRIFGFQPNEFEASYEAFLEAVHPEDREEVNEAYISSINDHRDHYEIEHRVVQKRSGKILYVHEKCEHVRDESGKIVRSIGMVHDITVRKQKRMEIERLNAELETRYREMEDLNKELEAFNYTIAHDLRKPLTVISGYSQSLEDLLGDRLDQQSIDYLKKITNSTINMSQLIDALLDFSRLAHAELKSGKVNLSDVANLAIADLKSAEPDRKVTFRVMENMEANVDIVLIKAVLVNLLGNAWKFTAKQKEALIEFEMKESDGKNIFFIRDNGVGFSMEEAQNLFAPFQRLLGIESITGFGVGLATVERIIHRHGGQIWAEGIPGKGATFYFSF
jgi:PAS domain S-box-containing protein